MPISVSDPKPPPPTRAEDRPVLIYDGDCDFCRFWATRWKQSSGDRVRYRASQDLKLPEGSPARSQLNEAVHLVEPDGQTTSGAAAVFRLRELGLGRPRLARAYRSSPRFAWISDRVYRLVAGHRPFFSCLTRAIHGRKY